jgi:ABC-type lipoprotein export system ATPase subunit
VDTFLGIHARVRNNDATSADDRVRRTLAFANELTGEPIAAGSRMTELSGGQTRALLLADAAVICSTPIVLLDEVENAGIHRQRALERLREQRKLFLFVTHDPRIVLLSDCRIVMRNGGMVRFLRTTEAERRLSTEVNRMDDALTRLRDRIRQGDGLGADGLETPA